MQTSTQRDQVDAKTRTEW